MSLRDVEIPHDLIWDRTQGSKVRSRQLTT
jgi:hypothetical protein